MSGNAAQLEVRELEGNCTGAQEIADLGPMAAHGTPERLTTVILDKAPAALREQRVIWEQQGPDLPPYAPFLNAIELVWKRLKGFLMPRRFYDSLAQLPAAIMTALNLLGAVFIENICARY
ncbi:hypothetical protein [Deinococcus sp. QL22]|uniref:hypothetical protein n=1 Tax=Deinococcus sp. QL22 TaxID=2939437 RepID=UPI00201824C8|nr:hypothetical protein [Deinococcus sp. QL22]UQN09237.1 hypothetical protein M1R55_24725 [Deinococcus sp. QL22]